MRACFELLHIINSAYKGDVDTLLYHARNIIKDDDIDWYKTTDLILDAVKKNSRGYVINK